MLRYVFRRLLLVTVVIVVTVPKLGYRVSKCGPLGPVGGGGGGASAPRAPPSLVTGLRFLYDLPSTVSERELLKKVRAHLSDVYISVTNSQLANFAKLSARRMT